MQLNTSNNVIAKCIIAHNCAYIIDPVDIERQGLKVKRIIILIDTTIKRCLRKAIKACDRG